MYCIYARIGGRSSNKTDTISFLFQNVALLKISNSDGTQICYYGKVLHGK